MPPALKFSFEDVQRRLEKTHPHVIGVQTTTPTIRQAIKAAKNAKEVVPDACVVLRDYHVSFLQEETMKECPGVDICVRGEAEYTMLELM